MCIIIFFPAVKKKKIKNIKSVNHNHYQSSVCWGSPKGHQIPVWDPLEKPSFSVCGGGGAKNLFRPITERAGPFPSRDWTAGPRSRGKTGRDSFCHTRLSKPKGQQSDTATTKGFIVSGKRTWAKCSQLKRSLETAPSFLSITVSSTTSALS